MQRLFSLECVKVYDSHPILLGNPQNKEKILYSLEYAVVLELMVGVQCHYGE